MQQSQVNFCVCAFHHICLSPFTIISIGFQVLPPSKIILNTNTYRGNHSPILPHPLGEKEPVPFASFWLFPWGWGCLPEVWTGKNVTFIGPSLCNRRRWWSRPLNPSHCQVRALLSSTQLSEGLSGRPNFPLRQLPSRLKCRLGFSFWCQMPHCWCYTLILCPSQNPEWGGDNALAPRSTNNSS